MVHVLLATGFEEIEAITTIDILRRCGIEVQTLSVTGNRVIQGAHGISVMVDGLLRKNAIAGSQCIILPGGMPGVKNLQASDCLRKCTIQHFSEGKLLAAICAAPMVVDAWGVLQNHNYTCYPGCQTGLKGGNFVEKSVVRDQNLITANGPGSAATFAFEIASAILGDTIVKKVKNEMGYK